MASQINPKNSGAQGATGTAKSTRTERGGGARPYHRLVYRLCLSPDHSHLSVCPVRAPLAGIIGSPAPFSPQRLINDEAKERLSTWISDLDRTLLHDLADRSAQLPGLVWFPLGLSSGELLSTMVESKRAVFCIDQVDTGAASDITAPGIRLERGEMLEAKAHWHLNHDGSQSLHWQPSASEGIPDPASIDWVQWPLNPPWLINPTNGMAHTLKLTSVQQKALEYLSGEALRPSAVEDWMKQDFAASLPPPRIVKRSAHTVAESTPIVRLHNVTIARMGRLLTLPAVSLAFDYGIRTLTWNSDRSTVLSPDQSIDEGKPIQVLAINRHEAAEARAVELLRRLGLAPLGEIDDVDYPAPCHPIWVLSDLSSDESDWLSVQTALEGLAKDKWKLEQTRDLTLQLVKPKRWYGELKNAEGDHFDLDLGVEIDGESISMLPALMSYVEQASAAELKQVLSSTDTKRSKAQAVLILALDEHRRVEVPVWRVRAALTGLLDLMERSQRSTKALDLKQWRLRLPKSRLSDIGQASDGWTLRGDKDLTDLAKQLKDFDTIQPLDTPDQLNAKLRSYQKAGLAWLQFLRTFGFGGILADDMGLGKTIQTLAHLLIEKSQKRAKKPTLVVAPTSLMFNWRREAERFAPDLKVTLWHGTQRKKLRRQLTQSDLVLTSYPLIARDVKILGGITWHMLILDEAQAIKNPRAAVSTAVRQLKANHRLCLTGTPLENHLGELWSLFDFLMPGLLGSREQFRRWFRQPIEKGRDRDRQAQLAHRIRPFFLRRTKKEVMPELPDKTQIVRSVQLNAAQRRLYESQRIQLHDKVRYALQHHGPERGRMVMLDALLKLRQICCDPRLLKDDTIKPTPSAKLELLMELLPELIGEGRRVLLFSQFVSMLDLIEEEVKTFGIDYVRLTGQTKDREEVVERFQRSEAPLFLISLKAGGVGLNLTAADVVIHYDPWWNPAVEDQATDRAHRIGQDHKVFVYRLLTEDTVEQKVTAMQASKRELIDGLMSGGGAIDLKAEDLDFLFQPIEE
jgi:hypothetical protein